MTDRETRRSTGGYVAEADIEQALGRGDLLRAYDLGAIALQDDPENLRARYCQILALARMGETDRAATLYEEYLEDRDDDVDILSLSARILKDKAWRADEPDRQALLAAAATRYAAIHERTGAYFPGINAATLTMLAGDRPRGTLLAKSVLADDAIREPASYFAAATAAEAMLILGRPDDATEIIRQALKLPDCNDGARASTARQFALICEALGSGEAIIELLRPPPVLVYCGHMFAADAEAEAVIRAAVLAELDRIGARVGFGSLACGADIMVAEALLQRGGELHVVLPFLRDDFVRISVAPGGGNWVDRFERCLAQAAEVSIASETRATAGDDQYRYASVRAMGLARLRAGHLNTSAVQLAVWDGQHGSPTAGTGADVQLWQSDGSRSIVIAPPRLRRNLSRPPGLDSEATRSIRAMLFTDFAGFSRIDETRLPYFWNEVLGRMATVAERHRESICGLNSWGDAVHAVTGSAAEAARLALDWQAALAELPLHELGENAGMRISVHLGPVYEAEDRVTQRRTFFGREVNMAARIEPMAPAGQIFASSAFAAALAMEAPGSFELAYVGQVQLPKGFGETGMYKLERRRSEDDCPDPA